MTTNSSIAIILTQKDSNVDQYAATAAKHLKSRGEAVAGFLQRENDTGSSACCSDMFLEDIGSGARFKITQNLGSGSSGCRLDPAGLVDAVSHMSRQIDSNLDILFLNRFGKGEEEGRGFRPVIEAAFTLGIPTLIIVRASYLEAWKQFCGDNYVTLPASTDAIVGWYEAQHSTSRELEFA